MTIQVQRSTIGGDKAPCPSCQAPISRTARMCPECGATLQAGWADNIQESEPASGFVFKRWMIFIPVAIALITVAAFLLLRNPSEPANNSINPTTGVAASTGLTTDESTAVPQPTTAEIANKKLPSWTQLVTDTELRLGPSDKYPGIGIIMSKGFIVWAKERNADTSWLRVCVTNVECSTPAGWLSINSVSIEQSIREKTVNNLPVADVNSYPVEPVPTAEPTLVPTDQPTAEQIVAPTSIPTAVAEQSTVAPEPTATHRPRPNRPSVPAAAAARYYTGHAEKVDTNGKTILVTIYTTSSDFSNLRVCMQRGTDKKSFCVEPHLENGVLKAKFDEDASQYAVFVSNGGSSIQSQVLWVDTTQGTWYVDFGDGQKK